MSHILSLLPILIKIDDFSGPSMFSVANYCLLYSLSLTFLLRGETGERRKAAHSFCRASHSNLVSLRSDDAVDCPSVWTRPAWYSPALERAWPALHFSLCPYRNRYSWEAAPVQKMPVRSMTGRLLPKRPGVLLHAMLARCLMMPCAKTVWKKELRCSPSAGADVHLVKEPWECLSNHSMNPRATQTKMATLITYFKNSSAPTGPTPSRTGVPIFRVKGPHPYYVRSH